MSWPISASKLFLTILSFITSCIVLNWENQAVSVLCVGGGGGGGQNAAGNESFIAAIYPGAERRMEGWTQFKPNDESSLRAESHETWKLGFFYSVPPSLWTLYWSTNCLVVQEKLVKFSDLILPKAIKLPGTVMTVDDVLIPRHRTASDLTCRL